MYWYSSAEFVALLGCARNHASLVSRQSANVFIVHYSPIDLAFDYSRELDLNTNVFKSVLSTLALKHSFRVEDEDALNIDSYGRLYFDFSLVSKRKTYLLRLGFLYDAKLV